MPSIANRSDEIWQELDPSQNDHAKYFLERITENKQDASKSYSRAYYVIIILAVFYWAIVSGNVKEFSFLSIKLNEVALLPWVIPAAMSFMFYQGVCALVYGLYLQRITDAYLKKHLGIVYQKDFEYFINTPTFLNFELMLGGSLTRARTISRIFGAAVFLLTLFSPFLIIGFCIYYNLKEFGFTNTIATVLTVVAALLLVRALLITVGFFLEGKAHGY